MTARQSMLKMFYPALMKMGKIFGVRAGMKKNKDNVAPVCSFYELTATAINGTEINFKEFEGKNVLLVNTASDCGYTNQLKDLKKLHQLYKDELVVIGFPSNDFKDQEKLGDEEIASFCFGNFGVDFLLAKKSVVIKDDEQNDVFAWLSDKQKNGWNDKAPEWNFSKYLVNKKGILTGYFGPGIAPLSNEIMSNI